MQIITIPTKVTKAMYRVFYLAYCSLHFGFSYYRGSQHDKTVYRGLSHQLYLAINPIAPSSRFDADQYPFFKKMAKRCLNNYRCEYYQRYLIVTHQSAEDALETVARYFHIEERALPKARH